MRSECSHVRCYDCNFRAGSVLRITNQQPLLLTGPALVKGQVEAGGVGSAFRAPTNLTVLSVNPRLLAANGGQIAIGASTYSWDNYRGNATLLSATGTGSLVDLKSVNAVVVSYGDNGARTHWINDRSNGVVDLSGLTQLTAPGQDDWLEFNINSGGNIKFDALRRITGRTRINVGVPLLECTSATLFSSESAGSVIDAATMKSLRAYGGWGGAWAYSLIANNYGVLDLSGLETLTGARTDTYEGDDWVALTVRNNGVLRLDALRQVAGLCHGSSRAVQVGGGASALAIRQHNALIIIEWPVPAQCELEETTSLEPPVEWIASGGSAAACGREAADGTAGDRERPIPPAGLSAVAGADLRKPERRS